MTWLATLWHMCPEPIQLQCSKLFNYTQFTVGTSVAEKVCQMQLFKNSTPSDQANKQAFLERKDHLLRVNKALHYGSCNCLHICYHVGISA
jgi:hypothetical protein